MFRHLSRRPRAGAHHPRAGAETSLRSAALPLLATGLTLVTACSPAEVAVAPTTQPPDVCDVDPPPAADIVAGTPAEAAAVASRSVFECSATVVISTVDGLEAGTAVALDQGAPLLVADGDGTLDAATRKELERLTPERVVVLSEQADLDWNDPTLGAGGPWDLVIEPAPTPEPDDGTEPNDESPGEIGEDADAMAPTGPRWVALSDELRWATRASLTAGAVEVVRPDEVTPEVGAELWVVGDPTPTERWQSLIPLNGVEHPGGGHVMFPGRRLVALYGSPATFRLGLLGETSPQEAVTRLDDYLAQYDDSVGPLIPTFELIVTVADSQAGEDGDFSRELTIDDVDEWIDIITEAGGYAIIDLQPGRTDFLTQAKRYEELLRRPHVGLALDPEWRLGPDQVHLEQIGSVDAAEINTVVDWLAELVREEHLPQKVLLLHQFDLGMITNRDDVRTPPELAVVLHVDGQGPLSTKYGTWEALQQVPQGDGQELWWGWKNFLDEDSPMATPSQVDALTPLPVVITYQ